VTLPSQSLHSKFIILHVVDFKCSSLNLIWICIFSSSTCIVLWRWNLPLPFLFTSLFPPSGIEFSSSLTCMYTQGILTNETRCLQCETVTARDETFFDLSLDIEQNSSITSCLKNFSSTETLNAEDKFFCDKCCR
jgi:hypothetical protein